MNEKSASHDRNEPPEDAGSGAERNEVFDLGPDEFEPDAAAAPREGSFELDVDASEGPIERPAPVATPVERSIERGRALGASFLDDSQEPNSARLRAFGIDPSLHPDIRSDALVTMARTFTSETGGSLRNFSGGLAHECGWYPAWKPHRLVHWEGISARDFLIESECNRDVDWMVSEGIRFHFFLAPKWRTYTADVHMSVRGVTHVVEIKAREGAIGDDEYRLVLAGVAEICRRCGWVFRVVLGTEIFANRHHRDNCELFAFRRFVRLSERTMDRLEGFAMNRGAETTYGELAEALDPNCIERGEAFIQALTVRQRIAIDLTTRVYHRTPLRIL